MSHILAFRRPDVRMPPRPVAEDMRAFLRTHGQDAVYQYINAQACDSQDYLYDLLFRVQHESAFTNPAAQPSPAENNVVNLNDRRAPAR